MITATVRYKLPPHIDYAGCREHFHKIAPGFQEVKGLISKHFIWSESGWAGGVYQWERIDDAKAFYSGPWLDGRNTAGPAMSSGVPMRPMGMRPSKFFI
jgi:hypothetical protein